MNLAVDDLSWTSLSDFLDFEPAALDFVDCHRGWLVGRSFDSDLRERQRILRTDDAGQTWSDQTANTDVVTEGLIRLTAVVFLTRERGVVVGTQQNPSNPISDSPPLVLETSDGGETWTKAALPAAEEESAGNLRNATLFSACFTESGLGIASGSGVSGPLALATTDGGATWRDVTQGVSGTVACAGERDIWTLMDGPSLRVSADGGETFVDKTAHLPARFEDADFSGLFFLDETTGWIHGRDAGDDCFLLRTTDGGETWAELGTPDGDASTRFCGLTQFATMQFGVMIGESDGDEREVAAAAATTDGGLTWERTVFPENVLDLRGLAVVP